MEEEEEEEEEGEEGGGGEGGVDVGREGLPAGAWAAKLSGCSPACCDPSATPLDFLSEVAPLGATNHRGGRGEGREGLEGGREGKRAATHQ